jgi:hypothetical protein
MILLIQGKFVCSNKMKKEKILTYYSRKFNRHEQYHKYPTEQWVVSLIKPVLDFYDSKMSVLLTTEVTYMDANKVFFFFPNVYTIRSKMKINLFELVNS